MSETFFLIFPLFDKDEHEKFYLYNNFFYLYNDENKSEVDFQKTNKKIKLYCFIPFMILLLTFYIIIMIYYLTKSYIKYIFKSKK